MRIGVGIATGLSVLAVATPASAAYLRQGQARTQARRLLHTISLRTGAQGWELTGCRRDTRTRIRCHGHEYYRTFICAQRLTITLRREITYTRSEPDNPCRPRTGAPKG